MKKWTIADWEALYPEKLECMRAHVEKENKSFFTPSQMQRLHKIGYNHAMHVIEHGVATGMIIDPNGSHRFQYK
jgi:hypothetical protein